MTNLSRERREELRGWTRSEFEARAPTKDEVRALLHDSAWRERVERQVRELERQCEGSPYEPIVQELRSIVDAGDEEAK